MTIYDKKQEVRRRRLMQNHHEWADRVWKNSFSEDWSFEYFFIHMRAKLLTMERYNMHLSYVMNGPYYGHQIHRALQMIDIILDEGGREDYRKEKCYRPVPESFKHYVNMRNRDRIPHPKNGSIGFFSEAQNLRFDKAWMLLWRILSEQLMSWGD